MRGSSRRLVPVQEDLVEADHARVAQSLQASCLEKRLVGLQQSEGAVRRSG